MKVVINGAGAAGIAILRILVQMGYKNIFMCDTKGLIYEGRAEGMNPIKETVAHLTNPEKYMEHWKTPLKVLMSLSVYQLLIY